MTADIRIYKKSLHYKRRFFIDNRHPILRKIVFLTKSHPRESGDLTKEDFFMAKKANSAFMKPLTPSPALAEVVGSKALPRTQVVKKLWVYIKKYKLQDPKNKRNIKADATLKKVFGGKGTVNMFEMTKLVSKHLK